MAKRKPPLIIDRANEMVADLPPDFGASVPNMPTGKSVTFGKSDSRVAMLADAAVPVATAAVQPPQPQKDRLPDGSEFHARWDAKAKKWAGVLDIPLDPANPHLTKRFEAESGALTKLCFKLDDRFRAFLDAVSKAAGGEVLPGA